IKHITGIPHSPQGQGIVERAHQMIKGMLEKQKGEESDPQMRLNKTLFTLNYLCITGERSEPAVAVHNSCLKLNRHTAIPKMKVKYRDLESGEMKGP
ncbi:POK7 protein, partial [Glaucidium brasilianum]|nr:POK7 protein [Glaucidium brasilianum]